MAATLDKSANITKSNSEITEEVLFGAPSGGSFLMDVAVDGHAELIQELTDASRDKGAYAIREAISNAFDATIKSGNANRPITVSLPETAAPDDSRTKTLAQRLDFLGEQRPFATVQDQGVGMTADELRENFAQYGNSDKRGSGAIGSKGLGSKAPLAVADFFEVISTKHGVTTDMLLWREEGGNYAKVVSEKRTGKRSGTTVRIPVCDEDTRQQMVRQLTMIVAWNTTFDIHATIGRQNVVANLADGKGHVRGLGLEVGHVYDVPLGYRGLDYHWSAPTLEWGRYLYVGKVAIARSSAGESVLVDVWRNYESIIGSLNDKDGFADRTSIDVSLMGVRYPLLRSGSVASFANIGNESADYIVACDPGYLNFTVSRDDIKEDDAWRLFVSALRDGLVAFDQRPAFVSSLADLDDPKSRYVEMMNRGIEFTRKDGVCSIDGLSLTDAMTAGLFGVADEETGEVIDLSSVLARPIDDEDGPIRVLRNDRGAMYGIIRNAPPRGTYRGLRIGSGRGPRHKLSPKEIRAALLTTAARTDCGCVLEAVGERNYRSDYVSDSLDVIVLTNVGEGCTRIATADKHIRKYICAERQRPQNVSLVYVLAEGDYEPTAAERVILGWFRSCHVARFDEYLKECKSGTLLREKKALEEKARKEAERQRTRVFPVRVATTRTDRCSQATLMEIVADDPSNTFSESREYVCAYDMTPDDIMAILCPMSDTKCAGIASAWALLETTGKVAMANGDCHRRLVIVDSNTATDMGVYKMGDERRFDILVDQLHALPELLPDGIRFDGDERVRGSMDAFGITTRSANLMAAALRGEKDIHERAIGSFYQLAGTTGNERLDAVLSGGSVLDRWLGKTRRYNDGVGYRSQAPIQLSVPDRKKDAYDDMHETAVRLTRIWNKGIGQLAMQALAPQGVSGGLPNGLSKKILHDAMAAVV